LILPPGIIGFRLSGRFFRNHVNRQLSSNFIKALSSICEDMPRKNQVSGKEPPEEHCVVYCVHVDDKTSIISMDNSANNLIRFLPFLQLACDPARITA
jgi:hypothetical protein